MISQLLNRFFSYCAFRIPGGFSLRPTLHRLRGVHIGKNVWLSQMVYIDENHPEAITIGDNTAIGLRVTIFAHFYSGPRRSGDHAKAVTIEEDVFIGPHCVILPGVRIGKGSVIQAGTTVSRDVPSYTLWGPPKAGPIATVTVSRPQDHTSEEFIRGLRPFRLNR
jgi:acetyltransferase-like isoleucine patch superfamily enzyme